MDTEERTLEDTQYALFSHNFYDPWREAEVELRFHFSKPGKSQLKRMQDTALKNAFQASRNLLLDTVHADEQDSLGENMDLYPGMVTSYATALLHAVGMGTELGN